MKQTEYAIISIEKTEPPEGEQGSNWYQYTLGQGASSLIGKRRGTLKQVTEHAKTLAGDLNARRGLKVSSYGRHGLKKN